MSDVKWIKISIQMFEDEKIKLIEQMPESDTLLIIWIKLLSQAGRANDHGYIYLAENIPYTDEMLATIFNRPLTVVRMALSIFKQFGMIEIDDDQFICISNWEKHQNVAGLEKIRQQTRERVAKHRDIKRLALNPKPVTLPVTEDNATELELELELDKEKDIKNKHIRDLFDHYNSKNIINHKNLNSSIQTAIKARLKDYSYEQLVQAINNYATVYSSDNYWFKTKYALADLMRDKDVRKFIDDAEPLKNFIENNKFINGGNNNGVNSGSNNKPSKPYPDGLNF